MSKKITPIQREAAQWGVEINNDQEPKTEKELSVEIAYKNLWYSENKRKKKIEKANKIWFSRGSASDKKRKVNYNFGKDNLDMLSLAEFQLLVNGNMEWA